MPGDLACGVKADQRHIAQGVANDLHLGAGAAKVAAAAPGDITVLVADALHKAEYYAALRRLPLPKPATWLEEGVRGKATVLIDTIQRFKGLESPIVILWGLDTIDLAQRQELLYVGMSRVKSLLVIVGSATTCAAFSRKLEK